MKDIHANIFLKSFNNFKSIFEHMRPDRIAFPRTNWQFYPSGSSLVYGEGRRAVFSVQRRRRASR
jgi:hypothetical protein